MRHETRGRASPGGNHPIPMCEQIKELTRIFKGYKFLSTIYFLIIFYLTQTILL